MRHNNAFIVSSIVLLILLGILTSFFWYRFTSFYKRCTEIRLGMDIAQVETIMQPYLNDNRFYVSREGALWGSGLYISSNSTGNGCGFSIKNGKVEKIDIHFE